MSQLVINGSQSLEINLRKKEKIPKIIKVHPPQVEDIKGILKKEI